LAKAEGAFTDPLNPPAPTPDQTLLKSEFIRKTPYKSSFLVEDPSGTITVDGVTYAETAHSATPTIEGVTGPVAENGIYDVGENPDGEVIVPGCLYEAAAESLGFRGWLGRVGGENVSPPRGDSSATRAGGASRSTRGAEPLLELGEALQAKFP
jgi:hypothetical protein